MEQKLEAASTNRSPLCGWFDFDAIVSFYKEVATMLLKRMSQSSYPSTYGSEKQVDRKKEAAGCCINANA
jgi:hypothetical protein